MNTSILRNRLDDVKKEHLTLRDKVETNLESLSNQIVRQLPNYENAVNIIEKVLSDLDLCEMPSWSDIVCETKKVEVVYGDIVYRISFYSSQISFHFYKDNIEIGSLYYWNKQDNKYPLYLHYEMHHSCNVVFYGLNETTFTDYMLAAQQLTEHMDDILEQASDLFLNKLSQKITELEKLYNNTVSEIEELEEVVKKGVKKYEQMF